MTIIFNTPWRGLDPLRINVGEWQKWPDGLLGRIIYVPYVWRKSEEEIPTCPDCGTPFAKVHEYSEMTSYEANCLSKHDPTAQ
jgi:hypothetical protein